MFSKPLFSVSRNASHNPQVNQCNVVARWIQQFRICKWTIYLVILGFLIVFFNALAWIAALIPASTFDLYRSSIPCYPIGSTMLIKYLNQVTRR